MSPEELLQLVLDYTNTNDYDDAADGWLSTRLDRNVLTVKFEQDSDAGKPTWSASWELREVVSETWYLAICQACTPILPQPFTDEQERDEWATAHHTGTGHVVTRATEIRQVSR